MSLCVCVCVSIGRLNQHLPREQSNFGYVADNFGNLGKNNSGNASVGNPAVIFG